MPCHRAIDNRPHVRRLPATPADQIRAQCADLLSQLRPRLSSPSTESLGEFRQALEDLSGIPDELAVPESFDCLLAVAQYFYLTNLAQDALKAANQALTQARQLGDRNLMRRAYSIAGGMLIETGNIPGATEHFANAIAEARALADAGVEAPVWNNLGIAMMTAAQYGSAIDCFTRAELLSRNTPHELLVRPLALANIAGCALHTKDVKTGIRAARDAIEMLADPPDASLGFHRVLAEAHYARLLLEIGETTHAAQHCESARHIAARFPTPRAEFASSMASGLIEIHTNNKDVGLTRLKRVLESARRTLRSEVREALSTCVAGYEAAGQPDVALVYLHEMLALNREAKAAQVLMHHSEYLRQVESPSGLNQVDIAMANQRGKLRTQLGERELVRNRILLLEQQSVAAELHDDTTGEHCYRVGRLASILGKEVGLEDDVCFLIDLAARLHDIGKLVVPDAILLKPGRLTPGEREIMETHTTAGADILAKSNVPQMHIAEEIARHHHERWDGSGYPMKLAGTAIPIAARVTALADVFDALTHKRPYKEAWKVSEALTEIQSLRGKQFDPELTDVFMKLVPKLQREHGDLDEFLAVEAKHSPFIKARKQIAEALKGSNPETTLFEARR